MTKMSRVARSRLWLDRLSRQASSGLTVAQFCQNENISVPSFYQWRQRLASQVDSPRQNRISRRPTSDSLAELVVPSSRSCQCSSGTGAMSDSFAELVVVPDCMAARANLPGGITLSLGSQPEIVAVIVDRLLRYASEFEQGGARC